MEKEGRGEHGLGLRHGRSKGKGRETIAPLISLAPVRARSSRNCPVPSSRDSGPPHETAHGPHHHDARTHALANSFSFGRHLRHSQAFRLAQVAADSRTGQAIARKASASLGIPRQTPNHSGGRVRARGKRGRRRVSGRGRGGRGRTSRRALLLPSQPQRRVALVLATERPPRALRALLALGLARKAAVAVVQ